MTCDEIRQLEALAEAFGEMRKMVISNPLFSDRYVLKTLNNIISYMILAKEENALSYNEILDTVKANYRSLFFPKAGFSEFHFLDESFEVQKQKNRAFESVKEKIEARLETGNAVGDPVNKTHA